MQFQKTDKITIQTDGGSRGNPGPAAAAYILRGSSGKKLAAKSVYLGETTNNVAEYSAVVKALEAAKDFGGKEVAIYCDSELLVKQVNGQYRVKSEKIAPLFRQVIDLLAKFDNYEVRHVRREKNTDADKLVNQALDLGHDVEYNFSETSSNIKPVRLGVLLSGGGRTLLNILDCIKAGSLNAEVVLVISSRSTVAGVQRAKDAGLEVKIVRKKDYATTDDFSNRIEQELSAAQVDLVVQAGWLCFWKISQQYKNRVMNIHPALLPSFGGKGMWGHHVHNAVLDAGVKISGCTVHFCTDEYDKGPIILQRCCSVKDDDTDQTLAARVFEQECVAYPEAIKLFANGKITIENRKVKIRN